MPEGVITSLERLLSFTTQKQKIVANNIANISTEGYKRQDLKFDQVLGQFSAASQLKTTNEQHMNSDRTAPAEGFQVVEDKSKELKSGYNNVDIDTEMAEMAENTLRYKFGAKKTGDYYKLMQSVIKGGAV